jgi:hypothetical protein
MQLSQARHRSPPVRRGEGPRQSSLLKRVALGAVIGLLSINVWTGSPLIALWLGSRVQGTTAQPKMSTVFVMVVVLAALSLALVKLLTVLGAAYEAATGQQRRVRTHAPWLRSMRGEREVYPGERPRLTDVERILVVVVVIAVLTFEVWFFFFSASPIDNRSGRSAAPPNFAELALAGIQTR